LIVVGAFGAAALMGRLASPVTRRVASLHLLCVVLAGLAVSVPMTRFDQSRDYWLLAQAYKKQGKLPEAVGAYQQALQHAPDNAAAFQIHNNLGVALAQLGQREEAVSEYRQALALMPDASLAHRNLGLLLMLEGPAAARAAADHLLFAEKTDPDDLEVTRALAALSVAIGDREGARQRALKVLRAVPDDPGARAVLSAIAGDSSP
jgi:Flp pilus assembly protein TadD